MSNELKCSPSNWKVDKVKTTNIGYCVDIIGDYPDDLISSVWGNTSEECEANAHLIAASKDLYNALNTIHSECHKLLNRGTNEKLSVIDCISIIGAIGTTCEAPLQKANPEYKP